MVPMEEIKQLRGMVEAELVDCSDILCKGAYDDVQYEADSRMRKRLENVKAIIEQEHGVSTKIHTNSCYRPFYTTCGDDYKGRTDISDPRGHWAGLAIDISISRLAKAIWGSEAFGGKKRSYGNLLKEYEEKLVQMFNSARLYRIFWGKGKRWEFWHFSDMKWRPRRKDIRHLRWKIGVQVGALG